MSGRIFCCYCREAVVVADKQWVGERDGSPSCSRSPDHVHARQRVHSTKRKAKR